MSYNYWDTDASTTKSKLQADMLSALGTNADTCYTMDSDTVICQYGDYFCDVHSDRVYCASNTTGAFCLSNNSGIAFCNSSGGLI